MSFIFYNKQKEQIARKGSFSTSKTRIELCFNTQKDKKKPIALFEYIIRSYYNSRGSDFRVQVFLHFLKNYIRFTDHFNDQKNNEINHWWKNQIIIPLYRAGLSIYNEDKKGFFHYLYNFLLN